MSLSYKTILLIIISSILTGKTACFQVVSFQIVDSSVEFLDHDSVSLMCQTGRSWEYCSWSRGNLTCQLEWKRAEAGVVVENCDDDLIKRVDIGGEYGKHQCGLIIHNVTTFDSGYWKCQMEEYNFGDWVSGAKDEAVLKLIVGTSVLTDDEDDSVSTTLTSSVETATTTAGLDAGEHLISLLKDLGSAHDVLTENRSEETLTRVSVPSEEPGADDSSKSHVVGLCIGAVMLVSLVSTTVVIWSKKCRGQFNMKEVEEEEMVAAKQILDNMPMSMAELIKMEK